MTGFLRNVFGSDKANDAQVLATQQATAGDQAALDYLKQREALPTAMRDEALAALHHFYTLPDQPGAPMDFRDPKGQQALIDEAMSSPLYAAIMGTKQGAVDELARYASATGGLRSGNAQSAFAKEGQRISEEALLKSYLAAQEQDRFALGREDIERDYLTNRDDYGRALNLSGLSGLAGLQDNSAGIAQLMSNMGHTQAQGTLGQAQTQTAATNNVFQTLLGGATAAGALGWQPFSDIRLKTNIQPLGKFGDLDWYEWDWNDTAQNELGLSGKARGVMAHQVFLSHPQSVHVDKTGYLVVDYSAIPELH